MVIEINKDIQKYKESVALGLTAKQLIFSLVSVVIGGLIVLLTYKYVGLTTSAYIAIPVVAPIALSGFYSFNGMSFMEMIRLRMHFLFHNQALTFHSSEGEMVISKIRQEEAIAEKKNRKKAKGKKEES
ncbi:MAG: PrgI family protein [Lachnospiraceae bacterium]